MISIRTELGLGHSGCQLGLAFLEVVFLKSQPQQNPLSRIKSQLNENSICIELEINLHWTRTEFQHKLKQQLKLKLVIKI